MTDRPDWLAPLDDPRDEEILAAAFDVFVDKGCMAQTMLNVARRRGASKETLYARFDSKEGLSYPLLAWNPDPVEFPGTGRRYRLLFPSGRSAETTDAVILTTLARPEALAVYRVAVSEAGARRNRPRLQRTPPASAI